MNADSSLRFKLYVEVLILVILVTDSRKTRFNYLHSVFNSILILLGSCGTHIYAPFYTHFHSLVILIVIQITWSVHG